MFGQKKAFLVKVPCTGCEKEISSYEHGSPAEIMDLKRWLTGRVTCGDCGEAAKKAQTEAELTAETQPADATGTVPA